MSYFTPSDRREYPRFPIQLPLSLAVSGEPQEEALNATALNVSENGVYCTLNRYLPLFDKVLMTFVLPEEPDNSYHLVSRCEGIVVRIEPEEEEPGRTEYQAAVYFNSLTQPERQLLQSLIASYVEA